MDVKEMAKLGGKASVKSRFKGKTKKEISAEMSRIRLRKKASRLIGEVMRDEMEKGY